MKLQKEKNKIVITNDLDFNIIQTLECGQVFSFIKPSDNSYVVISTNKIANITYDDSTTIIESNDIDYFYNYFDLNTDYNKIKKEIISINPNVSKYLGFGDGIRILKQDIYQTIISFIVSANNNIKRIKGILFRLSSEYGSKISEGIYAFPTLEQLSKVTSEDYARLGAGYRSDYLVKTINSLKTTEYDINFLKSLSTIKLREKLLSLSGVGPKVADCILLFGFGRTDVFPVDTWIRKTYYLFEQKKLSDKDISNYFVNIYGTYSGYAQQYLFNYMINHSKEESF